MEGSKTSNEQAWAQLKKRFSLQVDGICCSFIYVSKRLQRLILEDRIWRVLLDEFWVFYAGGEAASAVLPLIISKHSLSQCFRFDYFPNPLFPFKFFPPHSVCPSLTAVLQWSTPLYQKFLLGTLKKRGMIWRKKIWCNKNILCSSRPWCTFSPHVMSSGHSAACVCTKSASHIEAAPCLPPLLLLLLSLPFLVVFSMSFFHFPSTPSHMLNLRAN